jgi:hypothetical protein
MEETPKKTKKSKIKKTLPIYLQNKFDQQTLHFHLTRNKQQKTKTNKPNNTTTQNLKTNTTKTPPTSN